jgi:hypothetical protein
MADRAPARLQQGLGAVETVSGHGRRRLSWQGGPVRLQGPLGWGRQGGGGGGAGVLHATCLDKQQLGLLR